MDVICLKRRETPDLLATASMHMVAQLAGCAGVKWGQTVQTKACRAGQSTAQLKARQEAGWDATTGESRLTSAGATMGESGPRFRERLSGLAMPTIVRAAESNSADTSLAGTARDSMSTVERVAKVVSGISVIGQARTALAAAGWTATIAANRITVDDEVLAQFVPAKSGTAGRIEARWVIYSIAGAHPVWVVGAERPTEKGPSGGNGG